MAETSKTIDYSINNLKNTNEDNFEITFERKGEMQMPIDFSIYANDGKEYKYHIPNHWFAKKHRCDCIKQMARLG